MPRALDLAVRQEIHRLWLAGRPPKQIAAELRLSARTVRHLLRRFGRRPTGEDFQPSYPRCGPPRASLSPRYQACARLRLENPDWGAGRICVELASLYPGVAAPAPRLARRWLAQAGLAPQPLVRRPPQDDRRASEPHQVWQVDACEEILLGDGQRVCWLRGLDECSGAVLWTDVFPPEALGPGRGRRGPAGAAAAVRPLGPAGQAARR